MKKAFMTVIKDKDFFIGNIYTSNENLTESDLNAEQPEYTLQGYNSIDRIIDICKASGKKYKFKLNKVYYFL